MALEAAAKNELGILGSCLVEGDGEELARQRKTKGRALVISVVCEAAVLAAVVIAPLLARTPLPDAHVFVPIPPYRRFVGERVPTNRVPQIHPGPVCRFCFSSSTLRPKARSSGGERFNDDLGLPGLPGTPGPGAAIDLFDARREPSPPDEPPRQRSRIKAGGAVQAAMLVYRVDPVYPPLMQQIRKGGRIQLHAIISADGTIESLEIISGDPGFYQSALAAVRRWRYRPTILDGQPVEVETIITVIYNIGS